MVNEKKILRSLKKNRSLYRANVVGDILMVVISLVIMILSLIVIPEMKWYFPLIIALLYVISALLMYMSQKKYSSAAYEIARAIKEKAEDAQENYSPKTRLLREQIQRNSIKSVFYCIITGFQLAATWVFAGYYLLLIRKLAGNTKIVSLVCGVLVIAFSIPALSLFLHFLNEKKAREAAALAPAPAVPVPEASAVSEEEPVSDTSAVPVSESVDETSVPNAENMDSSDAEERNPYSVPEFTAEELADMEEGKPIDPQQ